MTQNNKLEALTSADMIEYKGKLYTPMERLSLLMEEMANARKKKLVKDNPEKDACTRFKGA